MRSALRRAVCVGIWTAILSSFWALGSMQVFGTPTDPCEACLCRNMKAKLTVPDAITSTWYFLINEDGSYTLSTQAIAAGLGTSCDDPVPTKTTGLVIPLDSTVGTAQCTYSNPPPGQTIYVEADADTPPPPPNSDDGKIARYVCAPP